MTWTFNPAQLATWEQATQLAAQIDEFRQQTGQRLGGGVLPVTKDQNTSGIYVPTWDGGPAGFPEPSDLPAQSYWLHFRFANGAAGINVGLILDKLKRYGGNTMYVFTSLGADLQS
jgi:hypothetical protein